MLAGQAIAHYRVLEKIGEGGMGVVFRGRDEKLGRDVAIKVLPAEFARDELRRKRFEQEARAAAAVNHANVATVFGIEEAGEELAIIYEFVRGQTLRLMAGRPLETKLLLEIAVETARALAAAHERGVVHRDIKPENIMRTADGVKVLDFGLARMQAFSDLDVTRSQALTSEGVAVGTVGYMSPEQLEAKPVDARSDVFSFGVVLYELATGGNPFRGGSSASTIARILTTEPPALQAANPLAPAELERIVHKCLRKDPRERYQSTRDLAVDLAALRRSLQASSKVEVVPTGDIRKGAAWCAAGIQVLYSAPLVVFLWAYGMAADTITSNLHRWNELSQVRSLVVAGGIIVLMYLGALAALIIMVRAERRSLAWLVRHSAILLGVNLCAVVMIVPALVGQTGVRYGWAAAMAVGPVATAAAVYLPIYQRRLLRQALNEPPRPT